MPILSVIAGPNGSGKSTLTEWVDLAGRGLMLDPDAVARLINPADPRAAALAAGREVLSRAEDYLNRKQDFAVETTLSSRNSLSLIETARTQGYEVHLFFVALNNVEKCITRIRNRSLRGGHFIPDADVRRRYIRSLNNVPTAIRLSDIVKVYDNSSDQHRLVLSINRGTVVSQATDLPAWLNRTAR